MKRNAFIAAISLLSEAGMWAISYYCYIFFTDCEFLTGAAISAILSSAAGLIVWTILDENLKGKRKKNEINR